MPAEATNVWDGVPEWGEGVGAQRRRPRARGGRRRAVPRGPEGGHQLRNDGDTVARVLLVAADSDPDVAEYPATGQLAAIVHGEHRVHRTADEVPHAGPE